MVITYHGGACFKVSQGDLTLAINPPAKDSPIKVSKFGADIAFVSFPHEDFNGVDTASLGDKAPFAISGPGEYDVKGVSVRGFGAPATYDGKKSQNTIYSVALEGLNLCFLGAMSEPNLPADAKQALDNVDMLFLPVGAGGSLDYSAAYKLAVQLEPKVVIPYLYTDRELKNFLKEAGAEGTKPVDKLTLKKKDLDGKEGELIVLSAN